MLLLVKKMAYLYHLPWTSAPIFSWQPHRSPDPAEHALDCSEITVRIHISKGLAQLRKWLSHLCRSSRQGGWQ